MGKVISLREKLETWSEAYSSPCGDLKIRSSNHGRLIFTIKGVESCPVRLDFVESVTMLSSVADQIEIALKRI